MKYLGFLFIFVFTYEVSALCPETCITGRESDCRFANLFLNTNPDENEFLAKFNAQAYSGICAPTGNVSIYSKQLKSELAQGIQPDCLSTVVKNLKHFKGTRKTFCSSKTESSNAKSVKTYTPCIPAVYVDYVNWGLREAFRCLSAISERPINTEVMFKKFNNESKFGMHISSKAGKGIGQMTDIAVKEVYRKGGGKKYLDRALKKIECSSFHGLIDDELFYTDKGYIGGCQLLSPGEGFGRNLLTSFILFAHHRERPIDSVSATAKEAGVTDPLKVDYLTLITFGREGFPGFRHALRQMKAKHGSKLNDLPIEKFLTDLSKHSDYIAETERSAKRFANSKNGNEVNYNQEVRKCVSGFM